MEAGVASELASAATAADAHVLLIRRHGRGPTAGSSAGHGPTAWALADTSPGAERIVWGSWSNPVDLLGLDLAGSLPSGAEVTGPQRLALVCTNGKRDQCCAPRQSGWTTPAAARSGDP